MARVMITGSADGLGLMAAELLAQDGHEVTLHARNAAAGRGESRTARGGARGDRGPGQRRGHAEVAAPANSSAGSTR